MDGNNSTSLLCQHVGCNGLFQFLISELSATANSGICTPASATAWATGGTNGNVCGKESVFGNGATTQVLWDGTFDDLYYSGSGTTGNVWSCSINGLTGEPKLIKSPLGTSGFGSTNAITLAVNAVVGTWLTSAAATCSPVSEVYNGTTDWAFLSVSASGTQSVCSGACLYNFNITGDPGLNTLNATAGIAAMGGTSGIVVDNTSSAAGASQIYYAPLGNQSCTTSGGTGGCAVQASQSGLQ